MTAHALKSLMAELLHVLSFVVFQLSPLGVLRSTLCGHWAYEAVVDSWPSFTALVLRPNKDRVSVRSFCMYSFTRDIEILVILALV